MLFSRQRSILRVWIGVAQRVPLTDVDVGQSAIDWLRPVAEWHCAQFADRPGLYCLHNVLSDSGRAHLTRRCVNDWAHDTQQRANVDASSDGDGGGRPLHKLRWVTLGYHYDWTNKVSAAFYSYKWREIQFRNYHCRFILMRVTQNFPPICTKSLPRSYVPLASAIAMMHRRQLSITTHQATLYHVRMQVI